VPNNSATRLSEVAHEIWKIAGSDPAVRVWPRVLDVSGFDGWKKNVEIARMVGLCRQQVDGLRRDIEAAPQGARYEWVLKPLEGMFSYDEPSNRWDSTVRAHLNDGLLATLKTLGDFSSRNGRPVPPKALESARSLVARIRKAVMAAELPDVVRQFLLGQVELMERGFREFPLRGPEAFRASRDAAAVEWFTAPPALLPYTNDRVVKKNSRGLAAPKTARRGVWRPVGRRRWHPLHDRRRRAVWFDPAGRGAGHRTCPRPGEHAQGVGPPGRLSLAAAGRSDAATQRRTGRPAY